jgi:hypothetical protein
VGALGVRPCLAPHNQDNSISVTVGRGHGGESVVQQSRAKDKKERRSHPRWAPAFLLSPRALGSLGRWEAE